MQFCALHTNIVCEVKLKPKRDDGVENERETRKKEKKGNEIEL